MTDSGYYLPAGALFLAFLLRLPVLVRERREPLVRLISLLIAVACVSFLCAAPPSLHLLNSLTGVPNIGAPLVYSLVLAFAAGCLTLVVRWRGGSPERTRRLVRGWAAMALVTSCAVAVLFALGEAPVERPRDLDTYYALTPYIREAIVCYLLAHTATALVVTVMCARWSGAVGRGTMRTGLRILVGGFALNAAFGVAKLVAVVARWLGAGPAVDPLSTDLAPALASGGSLLVVLGFLLPSVGPRVEDVWRAWRTHRAMGPLWAALHAAPARAPYRVPLPFWAVTARAEARATEIADRLVELRGHLDVDRKIAAGAAARRAGQPPARAEGIGDAAMIDAALRDRAAGEAPCGDRRAPGSLVDTSPERLAELSRVFAARHAVPPRALRPVPTPTPKPAPVPVPVPDPADPAFPLRTARAADTAKSPKTPAATPPDTTP
ncbi:MAB_1171c family putative transporter (plasmid) [Streptomyces sp. BI20]|uniref:MAB_1171c family putative transporter n=1 Tax=Streptomyces sp. BI20 TaxID=3403460 RepID=UPI003C7793F3